MRVLGRIRLSRFTDASTSPERQREIIEQWAKMHDHEIVGWAEDIDVSRSVDPFEAPELGPWFREDRAHLWDIVACWKLDRLATGSIYLNKVMGWCNEHDKALVSVTENFDLSTWVGRMVANVIAGVAEGELEAIKERTRASARKLRELGRWRGSTPAFGYTPKANDGGNGWTLVHDDEAVKLIRKLASDIMSGASLDSLARGLNEQGVPTPADWRLIASGKKSQNRTWRGHSIGQVMKSPALLGYSMHKKQIVRGDDGLPVMMGDPILSRTEWDSVQREITGRRNPDKTRRTYGASPYLGVARCDECTGPLYIRPAGQYRYYRCTTTEHTQGIIESQMHELIEDAFMHEIGNEPRFESVFVPGEDHSEELTAAISAVDDLSNTLVNLNSQAARRRITDQITALDNRIAELEARPRTAPQYVRVPTGKTWGDMWREATPEERRQVLIKAGITARASLKNKGRAPGQSGVLTFHLDVPADIRERVAA